MSFSIDCDRCDRKFGNRKSLSKHRIVKHSCSALLPLRRDNFKDADGNILHYVLPRPAKLAQREKSLYLGWLSCITERVNGAHHPKFQGMLFKIRYYRRAETKWKTKMTATCDYSHFPNIRRKSSEILQIYMDKSKLWLRLRQVWIKLRWSLWWETDRQSREQ